MAKTILIADDNPMIRKMLCQLLKVEEDYSLSAEATNGQEAIDLETPSRPDNSGYVDAYLERDAGRL